MNKCILLIGAGQLGSRHLQGILKVNLQMDVFVFDPSDDSLQIARQRANEIDHVHHISYLTSWEALPDKFDLVIVATNADVRENVINSLLERHLVKYLILEKVLFQEIDAYHRISDLLEKHYVLTWVNHPRRMFDVYQQLKSEINDTMPKVYQMTGGNWGLGCNGLHFIDLFAFLSSSKVASIDAEWVITTVQQSKRKGFIEFTGTIKGTLADNSIFQITSLPGEPSAGTITVFDCERRYVIQESGTPQIYSLQKEKKFEVEKQEFKMEFQSTLTTKLVNSLFENGRCELPTFADAKNTHMLFISALLKKYILATGISTKILPIT